MHKGKGKLRQNQARGHTHISWLSFVGTLTSQNIWQGNEFGSLVVCLCNRQVNNSANIIMFFACVHIHMAIPYRITNCKIRQNLCALVIWGSTTNPDIQQVIITLLVRIEMSICLMILCKQDHVVDISRIYATFLQIIHTHVLDCKITRE